MICDVERLCRDKPMPKTITTSANAATTVSRGLIRFEAIHAVNRLFAGRLSCCKRRRLVDHIRHGMIATLSTPSRWFANRSYTSSIFFQRETMGDKRPQVCASGGQDVHQPPHPFLPARAKGRHDDVVAESSRECVQRQRELAGVDAQA